MGAFGVSGNASPSHSFTAGGIIAPCRFVVLSSTDNQVTQCGTTNALCFGVSQEGTKLPPGVTGSDDAIAAESGDQVEVFGPGSIAQVTCAATIASGVRVKSDNAGKAIAGTTASTTNEIVGFLLTNGASGTKAKIFVHPHQNVVG